MEFLLQYPEFIYGLSVCICTFTVLKYFIPKPTRLQKFLTLIIFGIILGIITYICTDVKTPLMILAFFSSTGFYELIIKIIMRRMKTSYIDN